MPLCTRDPRPPVFAELNMVLVVLLTITFHTVAQNAACRCVGVFSLYHSSASYLK